MQTLKSLMVAHRMKSLNCLENKLHQATNGWLALFYEFEFLGLTLFYRILPSLNEGNLSEGINIAINH